MVVVAVLVVAAVLVMVVVAAAAASMVVVERIRTSALGPHPLAERQGDLKGDPYYQQQSPP